MDQFGSSDAHRPSLDPDRSRTHVPWKVIGISLAVLLLVGLAAAAVALEREVDEVRSFGKADLRAEADGRIDDAVHDLALRLSESRHFQPDPALQDDRAAAVARVASSPDRGRTVIAADGAVMRDRGATIVVRFEQTFDTTADGTPLSVTRCVEFVIRHPWYEVTQRTLDCPDAPTPVSLVPPPSTLPFLGGSVPAVLAAVQALPAEAHTDAVAVATAVRTVTSGDGAEIDYQRRAGVVGVAVKRGIDCILVRVETEVEVWSPGQVSRAYRLPGDSSCTAFTAIQRGYQHPPH